MNVEEWLGSENQLGMDIWNKKYRNEQEDFEGWITRVSGGNEEIAKYIKEKNFFLEEEFYPIEEWISRGKR